MLITELTQKTQTASSSGQGSVCFNSCVDRTILEKNFLLWLEDELKKRKESLPSLIGKKLHELGLASPNDLSQMQTCVWGIILKHDAALTLESASGNADKGWAAFIEEIRKHPNNYRDVWEYSKK